MVFYIEEFGDALAGWVLPDRHGAVPTVIVVLDEGRRRIRLTANWHRPDVQEAGHHPTGECGIFISAETCEGYTPGCAIDVFEADSNILIYRRREHEFSKVCLYQLETQTFPIYPLSRMLSGEIRMIYSNVELIGDLSRTYLTHSPFDSMLISGSALYASMRLCLKPNFIKCILLSQPLRQVASTLLLAKMLAASVEEGATWRSLGMDELMATLKDVELTDRAELSRVLKRLSDETFYALANPTTRKLVAKLPEDKLGPQHLGGALHTLAEFEVIGFDDDLARFREDLQARSGLDAFEDGELQELPGLQAIIATLESCAVAHELVDLDRAVFETARAAAG